MIHLKSVFRIRLSFFTIEVYLPTTPCVIFGLTAGQLSELVGLTVNGH